MISGRPASTLATLSRMRRDIDEPRADAQRRLGRQADRARHSRAAADEQQPAARALVRAARPPRQRALEIREHEASAAAARARSPSAAGNSSPANSSSPQ